MARKKRIQSGEKVGLKLTRAERALLLERVVLIPTEVKEVIDSTPPGKPAMVSLYDLDDLAAHVAAEANHTKDKKVQKAFDRISQKIEDLLERSSDETDPPGAMIHHVDPLAGDDLQEALEEDHPVEPSRKPVPKADRIYQFRITLKHIKPPIWRRIQVPDCSLGDLHELIQTVVGWKDCHLHQFIVNGEYYGQPEPDDLDLDLETEDEEGVLLSKITKGKRKVRFRYDYDFVAGWQHEVVFEHVVAREPKVKYPRSVDGARACPPENVGGPSEYDEFLEVITNPKHEDHEMMKEWIGDKFDPESFDVNKVNRELRRLWSVLYPTERTP